MPDSERVSRHDFPLPEGTSAFRTRVLVLMADGIPRSEVEMQDALRTRRPIGPRIRELRDTKRPQFGSWPFVDVRAKGPDDDGVYRHHLLRIDLTRDQRTILRSLGVRA